MFGKLSINSMKNDNSNLEFGFVSSLLLKTKRRKYYVTEKRIKISNLLSVAKRFKFQYNRIKINLSKDVEDTKKLTKAACIRPDIYLDNNNSCNACHIYENCACSLKMFKKKLRNN